jgi:hypothetical protein
MASGSKGSSLCCRWQMQYARPVISRPACIIMHHHRPRRHRFCRSQVVLSGHDGACSGEWATAPSLDKPGAAVRPARPGGRGHVRPGSCDLLPGCRPGHCARHPLSRASPTAPACALGNRPGRRDLGRRLGRGSVAWCERRWRAVDRPAQSRRPVEAIRRAVAAAGAEVATSAAGVDRAAREGRTVVLLGCEGGDFPGR